MMVRTKDLPRGRTFLLVMASRAGWKASHIALMFCFGGCLFVFLSYSAGKHCGEMGQYWLGTLAGMVDTR